MPTQNHLKVNDLDKKSPNHWSLVCKWEIVRKVHVKKMISGKKKTWRRFSPRSIHKDRPQDGEDRGGDFYSIQILYNIFERKSYKAFINIVRGLTLFFLLHRLFK